MTGGHGLDEKNKGLLDNFRLARITYAALRSAFAIQPNQIAGKNDLDSAKATSLRFRVDICNKRK